VIQAGRIFAAFQNHMLGDGRRLGSLQDLMVLQYSRRFCLAVFHRIRFAQAESSHHFVVAGILAVASFELPLNVNMIGKASYNSVGFFGGN